MGFTAEYAAAKDSFHRGAEYYYKGEIDSAIAAFGRALDEDSANYRAAFNLGFLHHQEKGDVGLGVFYYNIALRHNPDHESTLRGLGQAHEEFGILDSLQKAEGYYQRCCPADHYRVRAMIRDTVSVILRRAGEHLDQGIFRQAVRDLARAEEIEQGSQRVAAVIQELKKDLGGALAQAVSLGDSGCTAYDWTAATRAYGLALDLVAELRYAQRRLADHFGDLNPTALDRINKEVSSKRAKAQLCDSFRNENEARLQGLLESARSYGEKGEWKYAGEELSKLRRIVESDTANCIPAQRLLASADSLDQGLFWTKVRHLERAGYYEEALSRIEERLREEGAEFRLLWAYGRLKVKGHQTESFLIGAAVVTMMAVWAAWIRKRRIRTSIREGDALCAEGQYWEGFKHYVKVSPRRHRYFGDESLGRYLECCMTVAREWFTFYSRHVSSLLHNALGPRRKSELNQQGLKVLESTYSEKNQIQIGAKRLSWFLGRFQDPQTASLLFEILCRLYARLSQPEKVEETTEMWLRWLEDSRVLDEQMERVISLIKELESRHTDGIPDQKVQALIKEADSLIDQGYFAEALKEYLTIWEDYRHSFEKELGRKFAECLSEASVSFLASHGRSICSLVENSRYLRNDLKVRKTVKSVLRERSTKSLSLVVPRGEVQKRLGRAHSLFRGQDYDQALAEYLDIWEAHRLSFDTSSLEEIVACLSELDPESLRKHASNLRSLLEFHPGLPHDPETRHIFQRVSTEAETETPEGDLSNERRHGYRYSILLAQLYKGMGDHQNEREKWEELVSRIHNVPDEDQNKIYQNLTRIYLKSGLAELEEKQVKFLGERLSGEQAVLDLGRQIERKLIEKIQSLRAGDQKTHLTQIAWKSSGEQNEELGTVYADVLRERNEKRKDEIQILKKVIIWSSERKPREPMVQKRARGMQEYLAAIYQASQMNEEAKNTLQELRSQYPNDEGISRKLEDVNCELSKKLIREKKLFLLASSTESVVPDQASPNL